MSLKEVESSMSKSLGGCAAENPPKVQEKVAEALKLRRRRQKRLRKEMRKMRERVRLGLPPRNTPQKPVHDRPHKCKACHKTFILKLSLLTHLCAGAKTIPQKNIYSCVTCNEKFMHFEPKDRNKHLVSEKLSRTVCNKQFKGPKKFDHRKQQDMGNRDICAKSAIKKRAKD